MLVGLLAGWQTVRKLVDFKNFKNSLPNALLGFSQHLTKKWYYHNVTNQSILVSFLGKVYCEVFPKNWDALFFISIDTIKYYHT